MSLIVFHLFFLQPSVRLDDHLLKIRALFSRTSTTSRFAPPPPSSIPRISSKFHLSTDEHPTVYAAVASPLEPGSAQFSIFLFLARNAALLCNRSIFSAMHVTLQACQRRDHYSHSSQNLELALPTAGWRNHAECLDGVYTASSHGFLSWVKLGENPE
ncbi:hypothetical protein BKA64DRAFT_64344 [Cadophora sp. MPI-SDFR-AT-0126]|nr:hypothetical protein BKA64DRAFT_64344 [Leotiomycetes sp. MPI-SDFR-AT-0126]